MLTLKAWNPLYPDSAGEARDGPAFCGNRLVVWWMGDAAGSAMRRSKVSGQHLTTNSAWCMISFILPMNRLMEGPCLCLRQSRKPIAWGAFFVPPHCSFLSMDIMALPDARWPMPSD